MEIVIYQYPGACSRVTMTALEECGLKFEDRCVDLAGGQQKSPDYLAINPKGKAPALLVDGTLMTENAAILAFLDAQFPGARLLPKSGDPVTDARGLIDCVWCSSTIHPIVRQVRNPMRWTTDEYTAGIKADGMAKMANEAAKMSNRIGEDWWYGGAWSIVDTYVYWAYSTAEKGGFPLAEYPVLLAHAERVRERPSFQRALARERAAVDREGLGDLML